VLKSLVEQFQRKGDSQMPQKYANGKVHASSIVKTQRLKFFMAEISELANMIHDFKSMNLVQMLQCFCSADQ
jgi:hypothetical protein